MGTPWAKEEGDDFNKKLGGQYGYGGTNPAQRQPQNRAWRERGTGKGCSVGDGHTKNLRPRKVIERNTEKRGAPTDSKGTAQGETAPHTGIGLV